MTPIATKLNELGYKPLAKEDGYDSTVLSEFIASVGYPVPDDYFQFLQSFPATGVFETEVACETIESVPWAYDNGLLSIAILLAKYSKTPSYDLLSRRKYQDLPFNFIAIGCDEAGNYYYLDLSAEQFGKIFFLDHESDLEEGLYLIANSFTEFIERLRKIM